MKSIIESRISLHREMMKNHGIQVSIVPSSDPHQSEYISDCWKYREYLSGFTGSFGTLVIGLENAGFWTDSRYFLQAETELEGSGIELFKLALPGTPVMEKWISSQGYESVGIDGSMFSTIEALRLSDYFSGKAIKFVADFKPYAQVWHDRPSFPQGKLKVFKNSFSGESVESKIERTRNILKISGADCLTLTALDDIAWLFNFRGEDVDFNPVAICNAFVDMNSAFLFVESGKLDSEIRNYFKENHIETKEYDEFPSFISTLKNVNILFDKARNNYETYMSIHESCFKIDERSPVTTFKAIKNQTEISGFREAMIKDGVALTKLLIWLESETSASNAEGHKYPSECDISDKAAILRKDQGNYICESFAPIISFREHGAIVHYEAEPETASTICGEGVLLMDLGAHFLDGTTDMTRTIYLNGTPPQKFKDDFTCLLKGVIALTKACFPAGTRGSQLDILARKYLWERSLNYLHGTGHGVGHCLYVHEGPQSIRMNENPVTIEPGMIMSNEPALYRTGEYGVRTENVMLCYEKEESPFGRFFTFETLTLVPIDLKNLELNMLDNSEIQWINEYHQKIYDNLCTRLNDDEKKWLNEKTRNI